MRGNNVGLSNDGETYSSRNKSASSVTKHRRKEDGIGIDAGHCPEAVDSLIGGIRTLRMGGGNEFKDLCKTIQNGDTAGKSCTGPRVPNDSGRARAKTCAASDSFVAEASSSYHFGRDPAPRQKKEGGSLYGPMEGGRDVDINQMRSTLKNVENSLIRCSLDGGNLSAKVRFGTLKSFVFMIPLLKKIDVNLNKIQSVVIVASSDVAYWIAKILNKERNDMKVSVVPDGLSPFVAGHVLIVCVDRVAKLGAVRSEDCQLPLNVIIYEASNIMNDYNLDSVIGVLPSSRQIEVYSYKFGNDLRLFCEKNMLRYNFYKLMCDFSRISHFYARVEQRYKFYCLSLLLKRIKFSRVLIYTNSITSAERISAKFEDSVLLHTGMSIEDRDAILASQASYCAKYVVCSDVYPSNSTVRHVSCVINFDAPLYIDQYFNRFAGIGRIRCVITLLYNDEIDLMDEVAKRVETEPKSVADESFSAFVKGGC